MYDEIEIYDDELSTLNWKVGHIVVDNRRDSETFQHQFVIIDFDELNNIIGLRRLEKDEMFGADTIYASIIHVERPKKISFGIKS